MAIVRFTALATALAATLLSASAQAACWADQERDAVSVRELQTMLMVTSLRCRAAGIDITPAYNAFVTANRDAIEAANRGIKGHFAASGGAQADYDRFTTLLANHYGADATDAGVCAEAAATAQEATASTAQLVRLATNRIFPRTLPEGACNVPAHVVVVAAAAPPAPPAPVVHLPEDVVAALTVMARYGQPAAATPAAPATRLAAMSDAPVAP